jgi:hypothetical protein
MGYDTHNLRWWSKRSVYPKTNYSLAGAYTHFSVDIGDLEKVASLSGGKVHLTFGSALDIFGGKGVTLEELVHWNHKAAGATA